MYASHFLFSLNLKLKLESFYIELKNELIGPNNLGLDIKYTPFELVWLIESQFEVFCFFGKSCTVLNELYT